MNDIRNMAVGMLVLMVAVVFWGIVWPLRTLGEAVWHGLRRPSD